MIVWHFIPRAFPETLAHDCTALYSPLEEEFSSCLYGTVFPSRGGI